MSTQTQSDNDSITKYRVGTQSTNFHTSEHCPRVRASNSGIREISERDIEWHGMEPCPDCKHLLPDEEFEIEDTTFHLAISNEHRQQLNQLREVKGFENLDEICREVVRTFADDISVEGDDDLPRAVLSDQDSQKSTVTFVLGEYEAECICELVGAGKYLSAANVVRTAIQHYNEKYQTQIE